MAAVAEEHQLMGSTPSSGEARAVGDAEWEEGRVRDDDNDEILRFMDSVDAYIILMDSLSSALRQGWLDLASARHSMGPSRISSTIFDHKEQSAATKLQVADNAGSQSSESRPHFALSKWCLQEANNNDVRVQGITEPKLRYRGSATTPGDGSHEKDDTTAEPSIPADTSNHVQKSRSKALSIFGALVSPKLRTAQISFEKAIEVIVELANERANMMASFTQLKNED